MTDPVEADRYPERKAKALERLTAAVTQGSECLLSDVFHDAAEDGYTMPDGEGDEWTPDWGFDSDDLAAVLLPVLSDAFKARAVGPAASSNSKTGSTNVEPS